MAVAAVGLKEEEEDEVEVQRTQHEVVEAETDRITAAAAATVECWKFHCRRLMDEVDLKRSSEVLMRITVVCLNRVSSHLSRVVGR